MIDLEQVSGVPMEVTDDFHLKLKAGAVQTGPVIIRTFEEMKPVLFDKEATSDRTEMYYVYRGVCREEDKKMIEGDHLSFDITIIPPAMIGKEYTKTLGHYHDYIPGKLISHPEMYEIFHGRGLFLLQKMDHDLKSLNTVLAIEASQGDKIIYPPNYGHIIVNIGKEPLVTANWISTDYKPLYEPIKDKEGMALYVTEDNGHPTFMKNGNYKDQPAMRKMDLADRIRTDFGFDSTQPMYTTGVKNPQLLDFLNNPEKYAVALSALSS